MNRIELSRAAIERAAKRRGRPYVFETIDPARTALVVIDLQNFFMEPGQAVEVPAARGIVPNVNRLARACRAAGATVIWVQMTQNPGELDNWSVFYRHVLTKEQANNEIARLSPGDHGHALWPGLDVEPGDLKVPKKRFSAFIQGSSNLEQIVRAKGIDTLIITGTTTTTCCQTTALDAMQLNFKIVFMADATAAPNDEAHNAVLSNILNVFGDVRMTDDVVALLESSTVRAA